MSRLYIRVMTGFYSHRKTVRLRVKIGSDAFWIPPRLWAYAAEHQPDGNLSGYTSAEIAELIGCPKYASSILQALKDCGFIDENGFIHDWPEHNGYHDTFSKRAKIAAAARWGKKDLLSEIGNGKKKEEIEIGDKHSSSNATSIYSPDSRAALLYLNEKSGKHFRECESSLAPINARMKEQGVDIEGVKKMIDRQCLRWIGTPQAEYLRPQTLFGKEKFDSYYAARDLPLESKKTVVTPNHQNGF
jgi:uncharacterized phage protein (TIGR02220 family)